MPSHTLPKPGVSEFHNFFLFTSFHIVYQLFVFSDTHHFIPGRLFFPVVGDLIQTNLGYLFHRLNPHSFYAVTPSFLNTRKTAPISPPVFHFSSSHTILTISKTFLTPQDSRKRQRPMAVFTIAR